MLIQGYCRDERGTCGITFYPFVKAYRLRHSKGITLQTRGNELEKTIAHRFENSLFMGYFWLDVMWVVILKQPRNVIQTLSLPCRNAVSFHQTDAKQALRVAVCDLNLEGGEDCSGDADTEKIWNHGWLAIGEPLIP